MEKRIYYGVGYATHVLINVVMILLMGSVLTVMSYVMIHCVFPLLGLFLSVIY